MVDMTDAKSSWEDIEKQEIKKKSREDYRNRPTSPLVTRSHLFIIFGLTI